jgi:hypothetical protein
MSALSLSQPLVTRPSRWTIVLLLVWIVLGVRIGFALVRRESFSGDLGIPLVAFIMATAVVGSRVFAWLRPAKSPAKPDQAPESSRAGEHPARPATESGSP